MGVSDVKINPCDSIKNLRKIPTVSVSTQSLCPNGEPLHQSYVLLLRVTIPENMSTSILSNGNGGKHYNYIFILYFIRMK